MKDRKTPFERFQPPDQTGHSPERRPDEEPAEEMLRELLADWEAPATSAAFDQRVLAAYRRQTRPPFWRRLWTASIRVPAPVMAALLLCTLGSAVIALRALDHEPQLVLQEAPAHVERVKFVTLPAATESEHTRTVYVRSKPRPRTMRRARPAEGFSLAVYKGEEETGYFTQGNLAGFQPGRDMSFIVIKRTNQDEK